MSRTTQTATTPMGAGVDVLGQARQAQREAHAAEVRVLTSAVDWAVANPPLFAREAAAFYVSTTEGSAPARCDLTAEGVPDVDRAAVAELALAVGVSTQAAQALIADGLELAFRLPAVWTRVVAGEVAPWRARRIAQATRPLSRLAAGLVDRQLAPFADRVSGPQLDGLIASAMALHDKELAARLAAERAETRRFEIGLAETDLAGLTPVSGVLDLPDAQDLAAAVAQAAGELAAWGSEDSLDVRRARGVGELARNYLSFTGTDTQGPCPGPGDHADTDAGTGAVGRPARRRPSRRQVVLYVHLTDTTIRTMIEQDRRAGGTASGSNERGGCDGVPIGRVENTETPISADVIREWVADPITKVSIRPILDLLEHQHAGSYEIPARLKEQIRLRDGTCIYPGCHAKALHCQHDHTDPYDHHSPSAGGQTDSGNLRLLCQLHHNLKTHHGFRYVMLSNGAALWRTPHGLLIRRNSDGTVDYLTRHHRRYCDGPDCTMCASDTVVDTRAATAARRKRPPGTPLPGLEAADLDDLGPPPF